KSAMISDGKKEIITETEKINSEILIKAFAVNPKLAENAYLIIDTDMINALILAAKHGADVRIITPGIPDKKLVWQITRSFYRILIKGGVKVYEYTPGFIHSKVFVSDDEVAAVGTINLDYRSLYLHFENGTYIYGSEKIKDIRDDVRKACEVSHQVTLEEATYRPLKEFLLGVLRLFAPLL
ncbi:MAG: hypothetical protein IIY73_01850, partial [Solobacterium sp.]|nr:hypothetical protein [Solobacterium sp.]